MSLKVGDMVLEDKKDKSYINCSVKDGYVTVCYLVSGESEEFDVERCREVQLFEGTGYQYGNHRVVTVAPLTQEKIINYIAPHIQYNALYAQLKISLKSTQTWVGTYRK